MICVDIEENKINKLKERTAINDFFTPDRVIVCADNDDAMLLVTEWSELRSPDFNKMKNLLKEPLIFDGRNRYDRDFTVKSGFEYYQIGVGH